jgi:hypothetical protein
MTMPATDFQRANRKIPLPDIHSFAPADGQTLTAEAPSFTWEPVKYADGLTYPPANRRPVWNACI